MGGKLKFIFASVFFLTLNANLAWDLLKPRRIVSPPIIDGVLNDNAWQNSLMLSNFKTFSPDFGKNASQRTEAYTVYDSDHLYFAFKCIDNEPNKIKATIASRDNIRPDDWVCINLDSFFDQQSIYAFYVNPFGIQTDSRYAANIEDFSADYIWYSAGQLTDYGYNVEIAIPLKSIRYSDDNPVTMSIVFERYISRLTEHSSYPEFDPAKGMAFLTQMAPLQYENLNHYTLLEMLPAFTYTNKYVHTAGNFNQDENKGEIGLTTKYGLTSDLILDGTYNPDFSQIEADAGQVDVNLRYALYFPEKRPFFLEGSEIYNLAATQSSEIDPIISVVHTRNIVSPLAGFKLSGKLGPKNTLAAMYVLDELPTELNQDYGTYAHMPIVRYKRSFSDDSYLGGIITDRETNNSYNRVLGVDGIVRIGKASTVEWNGLYALTKISNELDEVTGHSVSLRYNYNTRNIYYNFTLHDISQNFVAEPAYLTRNDVLIVTGQVKPKFFPESKFFQRIDLDAFSAQTKDKLSSMWETYNYLSAQAFFGGALSARVRYIYSNEIFLNEKFKTGGLVLNLGGQLTKQFSFSLSYRKVNAIYYSQLPFQGNSNRASASFIYQPIEKFESSTAITFSDFRRSSDSELIYEYPIFREKLTYQVNRYLFFRGIIEYNKYRKQLLTDFLVSFTYVPGTVIHLGYGSLYNRREWNESRNMYEESDNFLQMTRGFFFKMSYLWRI